MRLAFVLLIMLLLAVAGGGWYYNQTTTELKILSVAAGPRGSDAFTLLSEIGEVLERNSDSVRLKVSPSKNSSTNITLVNRGEFDLATISSDTPTATSIRLVANLFPDYFLLLTRADTNIRTIPDLARHKIAIPEDGSPELLAFWSVIDHYNLPTGSFGFTSTTLAKGAELFLQRKVDGIFLLRSLRDATLLKLVEDAGLKSMVLRLVPVDQAAAIALKRPFISPGLVVRGAFDGNPVLPKRDVVTATVHRLLIASASADESAVREVTRILFENRLDLLTRFPIASTIMGANRERGASLPYHDGATSYYNRDEPSFFQENAEPIALIITILAMGFSGLLALRSRFSSKQKNRLDSYNCQLLEIAEKAQNSESADELRTLNKDLLSILEVVVKALDTDEMTEEGFQSFSLLWGSVRETINDRKSELR